MKFGSLALPLLLGLIATAGSGSPVTKPSAMGSGPIDGRFDVGGYSLHLKCVGEGEPTVLIDAGMGEPPIESGSWNKVIPAVSNAMRTCIYDRAGLGTSDPATKTTRTIADLSSDLNVLLIESKINGPLILVGHSIGGMNIRLYAKNQPGQVRGIVLVDSAVPEQWNNWLSLLPAESPNEPQSITGARKYLQSMISDPDSNPEKIDITKSRSQVSSVTSLGSIPIVVLTHSPKWKMVPDLPNDVLSRVEEESQAMQKTLLTLSTHSEQHISETAGHYIQTDDPDLVISAIKSLQ